MDSNQMIESVTEILVSSFHKTAKDYKKEITLIEYMFLLKDGHHYRCLCEKHEINVVTGIKGMFIQPKINSFITNALLRFSEKYSIVHKNINVAMRISSEKQLSLKLRNGYQAVTEITIEDLIKTL